MAIAVLKRLLIVTALVGVLALPVAAQAVPGDGEVNELYVHPSTTQAGGHPDVHLFFRFCSAIPHVTNATNSTPIVITTAEPHGLVTGDTIAVRGIAGNLAANTPQGKATVLSPNSFELRDANNNPVAGNGTYGGGGWVSKAFYHGCETQWGQMQIRRFLLKLPPGFLGNPQAVAECPYNTWISSNNRQHPGEGCALGTQVGQSNTRTLAIGGSAPGSPSMVPAPTGLYRVPTNGLEPARLGTDLLVGDPPGPIPIAITLRSTGDYGINSAVIDLPKNLGGPQATIAEIETVLCGHVPCTASNYDEPNSVFVPNPAQSRPFFVNPTSCEQPAISSLEATSWQRPDVVATRTSTDVINGQTVPSFTPTGCQNVPFDAHVSLTPTESTVAGAATAAQVAIDYGHDFSNDDIWESALRNADVTLPDGMTLSPGGGVGLEACSFEQFGVNSAGHQINDDPPECPNGAEIGTLKVETPVLPNGSLTGKVFFGPVSAAGRPTPDQPWKLFLLIEGAGLRLKLVGNVDVSPSGQIHNSFVDQPQVPFKRLELNLRGGDRAVLANPNDCQTHTGAANLTGWADTPGQGISKKTTSQLSVTPTDCPDPVPFAPVVESAGSNPEQAGANTTSHIVLTRGDGEDDIKNIKLSLPSGAVGSLSAVPQCALAQAQSGDCPPGTKIGTVNTTVGTGNSLLTTSGSLFLAEPSQSGDAATLALVVPAKAGPIDLGKVVVMNRVILRPSDTGVDTVTSDVPNILGGVPLHVRRIEINVDRPGFFINPTGCDSRPLDVTFTGYGGEQSSSRTMLNAKGCENLPFAPKLRLIAGAKGQNAQLAHPPLTAIVTQGPGEANIKNSQVILPDLLRPNAVQFNVPGGLCTDAQFAQGACPGPSLAGSARVITPVLPFELSGPVYVVQEVGSVLPKLYVVLRGHGLQVVLRARNSFLHAIQTVNTFDGLPDVPQAYFELKIRGGPGGILNNFYNACGVAKKHKKFDYTFTGQNGKQVKKTAYLQQGGCVTASSLGASISSKTIKVNRKGVGKVKIRCRSNKACKGKFSVKTKGVGASKSFSIKAKKSKTLKLKFSKKETRKIFKKHRMKVRAKAKVGGKTSSRSVVLVRGK